MPMSLEPIPEENEIECARCGALIYYELTRCPKCGVSLYEPEDEADEEPDPASESGEALQAGGWAGLRRFLRRLFGRAHPADRLFETARVQAVLYNELLQKVGGDRAAVDRLIEYERQRDPQGNRSLWLRNANRRWEQDNR